VALALQLGAPGIYELPDEPLRALTGVRMDVCAFVGVAPRGPSQVPQFDTDWAPESCDPAVPRQRSVPVAVESWSEYLRTFGAFEGPGLLPYAVASFFENGGQRAYVVRIVHDYGAVDPRPSAGIARAALAQLTLNGGKPVGLRARDEGSWGNDLGATLSFSARAFTFDATRARLTDLALPEKTDADAGALLRLTLADGTKVMRFLSALSAEWHPDSGERITRATFDDAVTSRPVAGELVEGRLDVSDGDGRAEVLDRLGLSSEHPRWLARVLVEESALLYPEDDPARSWLDADVAVPLALNSFTTAPFLGGEDRYADLTPSDFFDDWIPSDECPGQGVTCLADTADLSLLCAPDLYSPGSLPDLQLVNDPVSLAGPTFAPCVTLPPPPPQAAPPASLDGLRLDPQADLDLIVGLQQQLVTFADQLESFIVLLDVPPGLHQRQILAWRARFSSAYAACYHPWLDVSRSDDQRDALVAIPPSAVAAGMIALSEATFGVPYGPANLIAQGVVDLGDRVSPRRHDELHPAGVNVYLAERDGMRLTAARTLSLDPSYRQLSVRRLVTMLRRVLDRQMQWMVFEPNEPSLWADVTHMLRSYLRQLFQANAFRGSTENEAFFVQCDAQTNPQSALDAGQLVARIGIAPAEPLEFLVLQISRDGDGTLRITG
jgi:hypothetical protein